MMSLAEFDRRAAGLAMKPEIREAAWRVLCGGETWAASAAAMGVPKSSISRAIARIMAARCECCGQPVRAQ